MIVRSLVLAVSLFAGISVANACTEGRNHDGMFPKNNLRIPTSMFRPGQTMTEETFNRIIDGVSSVYSPIIQSKGATLVVNKDWNDATVNAYASRGSNNTYQVFMFGGLARHPATTEDGFALVVCHEIGHHIGGFPKKSEIFSSSWASNEGQADYFATTKCLRKYFEKLQNSAKVVSRMAVPAPVQEKCFASWGQSKDHAICVRVALAGQSMGNLFSALRRQTTKPDFSTPDATRVARTDDNHPAPQCRLDTYFQGGLCAVSHSVDMPDNNEKVGACTDYNKLGARSQCWFKPGAAQFNARVGSQEQIVRRPNNSRF